MNPSDVRPDWYHRRGNRLTVTQNDPERLLLTLEAKAAHLTITPKDRGTFLLRWSITHSGDERCEGSLILTQDRLKAAFMVPIQIDRETRFLDRFDAEIGVAGYFIRQGRFLNLPCPGTGADGDPNLSVFVTDDMTAAVRTITRLRV